MSDAPVRRLLLSEACRERLADRIAALPGAERLQWVDPDGADADWAFVSRDVTGLSTKHQILPGTQRFYDVLDRSPGLSWVHVHSAGTDRAYYQGLIARGVSLSNSRGSNAGVVAQTALAGLLSLARHFPLLQAAQAQRRWQPLLQTGLPADLQGQHVTLLGWGPVAQAIASCLALFGMRLHVLRQRPDAGDCPWPTARFADIDALLPGTDWLVLACPLSEQTQGLLDARRLGLLRPGARLINVARGEIVDEPALVQALQEGRLGGAYLDVFAQEPLPADSPLWDLPNTLITPHSAGFSAGNAARVDAVFLALLAQRLSA